VKRALAALGLLVLVCGGPLLGEEKAGATGAERLKLLNRLSREVQATAPKEAIGYATEAVQLAESLRDREGQAIALNNLGAAHYFLGEYDTALLNYERSLRIAEEIRNDERIANALNNMGIIHYMWGEYDKTLEYYARALEIRERKQDKFGIAVAHNNLGNVYYATERFDPALVHLQEAFRLYTELGNESNAAGTLNNIGLLYQKTGKYKDALETLERARAVAERIDDQPNVAFSLINIGLVHESQGKYGEALDDYRRSLDVRQRIGDRPGAASSLQSIGAAYAELGDYAKALKYQSDALKIAEELKVPEIQRDTHLGLSGTYERMGDFKRALESYERYQELNRELFTKETGRRLAELQARYEVEKKDRAIEILLKNQEIERTVRNAIVVVSVLLLFLVVLLFRGDRLKARANREMRKAHEAEEKATRAELAHVGRVATLGELSSVLAHELNQPLTAILANAQATRRLLTADGTSRESLDEALADIIGAAGHASELIKRLRDLLRRGDDTREPLDVNDVIRGVETFALADARRNEAALSLALGSGLPRVLADRVQIQQVLLNLVRNGAEAMLAVPPTDRAIVVTSARNDDGAIVIAVRDAGPAADEGVVAKMFDPFFTTKPDGLGMGLTICQTIVESHDGRLWATRNPDRGLTVQFTLPVAPAPPA
jgi:signal transduction histidine kinase